MGSDSFKQDDADAPPGDWLDRLLHEAREIPHKSPALLGVLEMFKDRIECKRDLFARFLAGALRVARQYSDILTETEGQVPVGIEFKSVYRESWALVKPVCEQPGEWTVVCFDANGLSAHQDYTSEQQAFGAMVGDGYVLPDAGALVRLSHAQAWGKGMRQLELVSYLSTSPRGLPGAQP